METNTLNSSTEHVPLREFTEKAYLDYSMYVILDRALPHLADGLKPVQRRIVYAMSELGLSALSKPKKSARTVGDVLGKYHPHGDTACYEAMVLMAQAFNYRYPLVDGQGNWGSSDDPKSFAAMRYTEARLGRYTGTLLSELDLGTVDWRPNFDGTLEEPVLLPARLPNVLLNGSSGIAVGMATDILPHNLREIANACVCLLEEEGASLDTLLTHVPGPDFPTQAEIISSKEELAELYRTGHGSVRTRAVYHQDKNGDIIITALPYQSSGSKVLEQIAEQMQAKKLPMVEDLRDESDQQHPTRLVIIPRSNRIEIDAMMMHLFATTDLERSYRVNFNMIGLDGRPRVYGLLALLKEWLVFRLETVRRRLQSRLEKVAARLHILEGLMVAFLNIDAVIAIIREQDEPKTELMHRFKLSEIQTDAVLEIKLRHLARLEEIKIRGEQAELEKERVDLEQLLNSKRRLKTLIRKEIEEDAKTYGDARRSPLVHRAPAQALQETDVISVEPITVILSEKGWIRAAKGHEIDATQLSFKSGDELHSVAKGRTNQTLTVLDSTGRTYSLPCHQLPSARGFGEPLTGKLNPPSGAHFVSLLLAEESQEYLLASDAGYGFITTLSQLICKQRAGKVALKLPTGAQVLNALSIESQQTQYLAAISNEGRLLIFPVKELPMLPRGKGNKIISIPSTRLEKREEYLQHLLVLNSTQSLILSSGKRKLNLKPNDWAYYQGERGRRGNKLPRGFQRVEQLNVE